MDLFKAQIAIILDQIKNKIKKALVSKIAGDNELKAILIEKIFDAIIKELSDYKHYNINTPLSGNLDTLVSLNRKRMNNAARQRKYRLTHKEERYWVLK
jgi:hypothetical protein